MTDIDGKYPQHETPSVIDTDRCPAVDCGFRCQLLVHDDPHHIAMEHFNAFAKPPRRVADYREWGTGTPTPNKRPGHDSIRWAATFPRVEN